MSTSEQARWVEHTLTALHAAGYRRGGARGAVIELLGGQSCALSAQEIDDELRRQGRAVGRASVYRILELLSERRLIQRVDVGQGVTRYEPMLPSGDHHHHVVCDSCGRIAPFDDDDLERAISSVAQRLSFSVDDHEVVLHGACGACRR
ncbi:MAG TPA: Fur family transcriptional regulator [Solirubrobacteraceae bacterium]|nr:Fur family transcriptional regulator [Solirubrobacteraceae bacterium]